VSSRDKRRRQVELHRPLLGDTSPRPTMRDQRERQVAMLRLQADLPASAPPTGRWRGRAHPISDATIAGIVRAQSDVATAAGAAGLASSLWDAVSRSAPVHVRARVIAFAAAADAARAAS
jgi:hypothetical protein